MKRNVYETPEMEIVEIMTEQVFAVSIGGVIDGDEEEI